jgi:hypothetical protein
VACQPPVGGTSIELVRLSLSSKLLVTNIFVMNILVENKVRMPVQSSTGVAAPARRFLHVRIVATVLGVFFLVGAAFAVLVAIDLLFPRTDLDVIWKMKAGSEQQFFALGWFGPVFLLLISAALVVAGIGLLRKRWWGRWLTVVLLLVNLAPDIPSLLRGDWSVAPFAVFVGALVVYLWLPLTGRGFTRKVGNTDGR